MKIGYIRSAIGKQGHGGNLILTSSKLVVFFAVLLEPLLHQCFSTMTSYTILPKNTMESSICFSYFHHCCNSFYDF